MRPAAKLNSTALWLQWLERRKQFRKHRSRIVPTIEAVFEFLDVAGGIFRADADMRPGDRAFQVTPETFDLVRAGAV